MLKKIRIGQILYMCTEIYGFSVKHLRIKGRTWSLSVDFLIFSFFQRIRSVVRYQNALPINTKLIMYIRICEEKMYGYYFSLVWIFYKNCVAPLENELNQYYVYILCRLILNHYLGYGYRKYRQGWAGLQSQTKEKKKRNHGNSD